MLQHIQGFAKWASLTVFVVTFAAAPAVRAQSPTNSATPQTPPSSSASSASSAHDRWLHVRVVSSDSKSETVRVNVPLDLAEKVLPTINKDRLHNGKVKIDEARVNDVDLHALFNAIRSSKDGEYVTVQGNDSDVRVAKQGGQLIVHVADRDHKGDAKKSQVEIKIPMKVIDALLSAGKDELDLVAALHALAAQGDTELVSVKDEENTVRIWLDAKNASE